MTNWPKFTRNWFGGAGSHEPDAGSTPEAVEAVRIPKPWANIRVPPAVERMPSMLTHEEKQYLIWLTAEKYEGWGAVVDLGPWLGSSSAALAEGFKRRDLKATVHSFDLFEWEPDYMAPFAKTTGLRHHDDFLPVFLEQIGEYAPWIDARKQDLMNYRWDGGPIEILFVDAAKTWELANAIFRGFGESLVPGKSKVVLQDFRYPVTHWLPLIFDSRPDLWVELEGVESGHTVSFVPLKPLGGPTGIQTDYCEESFPYAAARRLYKDRIERDQPYARHWFLQMLYRKCLLEGPQQEAAGLREEILACGLSPREMDALEQIESLLVPAGWRAHNSGRYAEAADLARRSIALSKKRSVISVKLLASSLFRLGEHQAAREAVEEVLAQEPDDSPARLLRAELLLTEGKFQDAAAEAFDVLAQGSGNNEDNVNYALIVVSHAGWRAYESGQYETSAGFVRQAFSFAKQRPVHSLKLLGYSLFRLGDRAGAREVLDEVLLAEPQDASARLLHAELLLADSRHRDAGEEVIAVLEQGAPNQETQEYALNILSQAGWSAYEAGQHDEAAGFARRCIDFSATPRLHSLTLLGSALFRLGDRAGAREAIEQVLVQDPTEASARLLRAELLLGESRCDEAAAEVLAVLRRGVPNEVTVHYALGVLTQAWSSDGANVSRLDTLAALGDRLHGSPSYIALLAREQDRAGVTAETRNALAN